MHWLKAFHIIFLVTWFSGLFYLPRLFVYHVQSQDKVSIERFKIMEKRLYYYITTPGGIITSIFGFWMVFTNFQHYMQAGWFLVKLFLVAVLWAYHIYLGYLLQAFKQDINQHSEKFYRIINEVPTVFLISIIILAEVKPF